MNKRWLHVTKYPGSFVFLLWVFNMNSGIWITWSNGLMVVIHLFKQMTQEEYDAQIA